LTGAGVNQAEGRIWPAGRQLAIAALANNLAPLSKLITRVFIYPNLIVICVPRFAEIVHLDDILSIITSTLLGGTLPTRRLIYILLHLRINYSVAASSLSHHILSLYSLFGDCFITVTRVRYVVHLSSLRKYRKHPTVNSFIFHVTR
jgi:hypothetical protein